MKNRNKVSRGLFLSCFISQGFWAASSLILLLLFCAAALSMDDPDSVTKPLSLCSLYIGAVVGGFSAVKLSDDGIMSGLISGAMSAVLLFSLSVLPFPNSGVTVANSVIFTLLVVPASVLGAFIGKKRSKKPKHAVRRR